MSVKRSPSQVGDLLQKRRVIGIVRLPTAASASAAALDAVRHGLEAVEVPFTVPDAVSAIATICQQSGPEVLVGAGTVRTRSQLEAAAKAGAQFAVAPGFNRELAEVAADFGLLLIPGAFTASEVDQALSSGCELIKLFPAMPAGPDYMSALQQPFPEARFIPTGGVGPENAEVFLRAGAAALGVGSSIFPSRRIEGEGPRVAGLLTESMLAGLRVAG